MGFRVFCRVLCGLGINRAWQAGMSVSLSEAVRVKRIKIRILWTCEMSCVYMHMNTQIYILIYVHTHVCIVSLLSHVRLFVTPWTVAHQAPLPVKLSRQGYWSGLPFSSPGNLLDLGIKPGSPALQVILYCLSYQGSPNKMCCHFMSRWIREAKKTPSP